MCSVQAPDVLLLADAVAAVLVLAGGFQAAELW